MGELEKERATRAQKICRDQGWAVDKEGPLGAGTNKRKARGQLCCGQTFREHTCFVCVDITFVTGMG